MVITSRTSDEKLLRRAAFDPDAMGLLFDRHINAVTGFLYRRCGDIELAADVASETFAAVLDGKARRSCTSASVRGWLLSVAANKLIDVQRRGAAERRARERLGITEPTRAYDALLARIDGGQTGSIEALVADLPPRERDAVRAVVLEERDPTAAAALAGVAVPTFRRRMTRGLARLTRATTRDPQ